MLKKISSFIACFIALVFIALQTQAKPILINQIIATVNNEIITQTALNNAISNIKKAAQHQHQTLPSDQILKKKLLTQLINQKLFIIAAKRMGLTISQQKINQTVSQIAKRNNLTLQQLQQKINHHRSSTNYQHYQQNIAHQLLIQSVQQQIINQSINDSDQTSIDKQLASNIQYHLLDIKVVNEKSAKQLLQLLKAGNTIQNIKKNNRIKITVVDLGWRKINLIPSLFVKPIQNLPLDQFTHPIKAPNGYHILQLIGKNQASKNQVLAAKNSIYQQRATKAISTWLINMKKSASIKIYPI